MKKVKLKREYKKQIEIWSTYPPPYGGVSIHSLRLFNMLREKYSIVFKNFNGDTHIPGKGIFKVSKKELFKYLLKRKRIIHLHSNRFLVWLLMCFYPKSTKILLTLHNQNLRKQLPLYKNIIIKIFFKKLYYIFLNDKEFADFLINKYNINPKKVVIIPAFITPQPEEREPLPDEIESFFTKHEKIISSFAWKLYKVNNKDVYGIDQIIDAFAQLKKEINNVGLILIIPIIEDEKYFDEIVDKIKKYNLSDAILIYKNSIRNGFDIWRKSDLFIRATTTDIEGISIKEALFYNTPVIATDVVERPIGVSLYSYGDRKRLCELMKENLKKKDGQKLNNKIKSGITVIEKIYSLLLE